MKKCSWCGSDYPDMVVKCPIDAQPLTGEGPPLIIADPTPTQLTMSPVTSVEEAHTVSRFPALRLSDRQLRIFELVLLCVIALAGPIYYSVSFFVGGRSLSHVQGRRDWAYAGVQELAALGLLWYILLRRSRSIWDLGVTWTKKDLAHSALVWLLGVVAFSIVFGALYLSGLTTTSYSTAGARVGRALFAGGVPLMAVVFQFINPFFEELIVRAYVMTEIRQLTNSVSKAVITSTLLQMAYHFYQGAPLAFSEGAGFLVFSVYYAKTNRITPIILAHLYMDLWGTLVFMLHH